MNNQIIPSNKSAIHIHDHHHHHMHHHEQNHLEEKKHQGLQAAKQAAKGMNFKEFISIFFSHYLNPLKS